MSLDSFKPGDRVEILVISEVLEESLGLMKFLQDNHIIPRKQHEIEEKTDITKTMVLKADTGAVTLTYEIASRISAVKV